MRPRAAFEVMQRLSAIARNRGRRAAQRVAGRTCRRPSSWGGTARDGHAPRTDGGSLRPSRLRGVLLEGSRVWAARACSRRAWSRPRCSAPRRCTCQRRRGTDRRVRGRAEAPPDSSSRRCRPPALEQRARVRRRIEVLFEGQRRRSGDAPKLRAFGDAGVPEGPAAEGPRRLGAPRRRGRTVWRSPSTTPALIDEPSARRCSRSWRAKAAGHALLVCATAERAAARLAEVGGPGNLREAGATT